MGDRLEVRLPRSIADAAAVGDSLRWDGDRFRLASKGGWGPEDGHLFSEEFRGATTTDHDHVWTHVNLAGSGSSSVQAATDPSEHGILRVQSGALSANARVAHPGSAAADPFYGVPRVGSLGRCCARLRVGSTTSITAWCGLARAIITAAHIPVSGNTTDFVGVRFQASVSANWLGICGTGGTYSTVDLGIAANTTWAKLCWVRTATGFDFYSVASGGDLVYRGSITTNLPSESVSRIPILGVRADSASARYVEIDYLTFRQYLTR